MESIITINHLTYPPVFDKFNLKIEKNTITFISGTNKCGKTTLIKIISGIIPTEECVSLEHSYVDSKSSNDVYEKIGLMMPHEQFPFLFHTVYQELAFPLENLEYPQEQIKKRIQEVAQLMEIEHILRQNPETLCLFDRNKLLIALAIIHKPKVLLLDDPCSMLNKEQTKFILEVLKVLKIKEHMTIVVTTDNLEETLNGDYLYILKKGKIVLEGKPSLVLQEEKILTRLGLRLPFMIDLSLKLKFYDLLDDVVLEIEEMVDLLWK